MTWRPRLATIWRATTRSQSPPWHSLRRLDRRRIKRAWRCRRCVICDADANLENFTLTGSGNTNGTGNALANRIVGNNGANTINGGAGNDTLTGGLGNDTFVFNTALGTNNVDRITDFNVVADTIRLENAIFTGLAAGTLGANAFASNTSGNATDAQDRIIYESDTGRLFFDRHGTGGAAKVHFATLNAGLALTSADFFVF